MSPPRTANTGPKAVLADAKHAQTLAEERDCQSARAVQDVTRNLERGMTISEEERREEGMEQWRKKRMGELRDNGKGYQDPSSDSNSSEEDNDDGWESHVRRHRRGAIREISAQGMLQAIERPGWALLFIYEPVRSSLSFPSPPSLIAFLFAGRTSFGAR